MKEDKQKTRDAILFAATNVFQKKGYNGARMQEIANNAKVNKAAVHYYFSSKEELFKLVFKESFAHLITFFDETINTDISVLEKIDRIIEKYLNFINKNIQNIMFVLTEFDKNINLIHDNIQRINLKTGFLDKIYQELESEMDKGKLRRFKPEHLFVNVISLCIFPFIAKPVIMIINAFSEKEMENFLAEREQVIKEFVKNALVIEEK